MPQTLAELKASSPAYAQMSDMEFASRIYRKHYADKMDFPTFAGKVGFDPYGDSGSSNPASSASDAENYAAGVGHSLYESARGVGQFLGDAYNSATDVLSNFAGQDPAADRRRAVDEQRRLDAPLLNTKAGMAGDISGTVGQVLVPGGVAKLGTMIPTVQRAPRLLELLNTAKSASLPATTRGAATQGGILGLLQPVGENDSRMMNATVGTGAAAVGAGAPRLASWLYRAGRNMTPAGAERKAAQVILAETERPNSLFVSNPSTIPGVQRTLAQETLDPGIARLERNARSTGRGFDALDRTNNAAHTSAIRRFAGDEAAMQAAKEARDAVALPALAKAKRVTDVETSALSGQVDDLIKQYTGNPAVQDGLRAAKQQIEASGGNLAYLENARQYIGRLISGTANNNGAKLHELMDVKDSLAETLGASSPEFATYLQAYANGSKPINRMQIGQSLLSSRSGSAILDPVTGEQVLTPAAFSGRARNMDRVAQEATQFKRAKAADYLQPEDFAAIRGVQDDLERKAFAATAGSGGNSQTYERMALNDKVAGRIASRLPFVGGAMDYLRQAGQARLQSKLSEMLASPDRARIVLRQMTTADRRVIETAISRAGGSMGALLIPALK